MISNFYVPSTVLATMNDMKKKCVIQPLLSKLVIGMRKQNELIVNKGQVRQDKHETSCLADHQDHPAQDSKSEMGLKSEDLSSAT